MTPADTFRDDILLAATSLCDDIAAIMPVQIVEREKLEIAAVQHLTAAHARGLRDAGTILKSKGATDLALDVVMAIHDRHAAVVGKGRK
jgi:hypothetical protein